jgi:ribonuclease P protein component
MRRRPDFEAAVRRGRRAGRRTLVVHVRLVDQPASSAEGARVGFVVSRAVGSAVVRNRVKRRLRAAMAGRLGALPPGALVVVRANPASAEVDAATLAADLDAALPRVLSARGRAREGT